MRYYYSAGTFYSSGSYGGYNAVSSFHRAKYYLQQLANDVRNTAVASFIALVGILSAWLAPPLVGGEMAITKLIGELFEVIFGAAFTQATIGYWLEACENALSAFVIIDNGEYVPSMTIVGGGASKGFYDTTE